MERNFKYKVPGLVFSVILIFTLILTEDGLAFIGKMISCHKSLDNLIISILAVGFSVVASDAIGYIFVNFFYAGFNSLSGYSSWFKNDLKYRDFKKQIIKMYFKISEKNKPDENEISSPNFDQHLQDFSEESLHVIFFWYRDNHYNKPLDEWLIRRFTAYITAYSTIISIVIALLLGSLIIYNAPLEINKYYGWVLAVSFIIISALAINLSTAKRDALEIIDLWIATITNKKFRKILEEIHPISKEQKDEGEEKDCLSPKLKTKKK